MTGRIQTQSASVSRIVLTLLGYALLAIPLGGYAWDAASDLLSGHVTARKGLIGIPVAIAFLLVLKLAASTLTRIDASKPHGEA